MAFSATMAPPKELNEIQFGILSPSEIETMSVGEVVTAELGARAYEDGGLMDLRQGPSEFNQTCKTCLNPRASCPGHFGHIRLQRPVFHCGFMDVVVCVLRSVCHRCQKLLAGPHDAAFVEATNPLIYRSPKARMRAVHEACKKHLICRPDAPHFGCKQRQPHYRVEGTKLTVINPKSADQVDDDRGAGPRFMTAEQVYHMLKRISDEDCLSLGLDPVHARPEWMLISVLPVAPPPTRPSTTSGGQTRGVDDLTVFYSHIVKSNNKLAEVIQSGEHVADQFTALLQYYISGMFHNNRPGQIPVSAKGGRALKGLAARIETKEGRVRNNLMGKRCDFSARTVITPDPNLSIDQVGVPMSIARNLTFPEMVTSYNIELLNRLVNNGPNHYPGAKYHIKTASDNKRFDLRFRGANGSAGDVPLEIGDIVERHIIDDDVIIFNRQPSLHKMSMMGHRIRVFPYSTFRLNLSVTTPYNADFDGDEMNLHVPQSHETRAEIQELMMVPKNIISPQGNRPCMGIVQDSLLGVSLFSRRDTFVEKDLMMNTLMWLEGFDLNAIPVPAILKPKQLWTGKQILSLFIPKINLKATSADHDDNDKAPLDTLVYINQGRLLSGILDKRTLGAGASGGLIHVTINELGTEAARRFFDATQKVVNYWLLQQGFSVGLGDTVVSSAEQVLISKVLANAQEKVRSIVKQTQQGLLQPRPGRTLMQSFEKAVNDELNNAIASAGKGVKTSLKRNNFKTMVKAGSKGGDLNISQIMACVGQQNVDGARIPYGFSQRTLPHFNKDDYGQESRGFVSNSYRQGLTPQEFFFHAMGGRVGLIDTAVKTSETGYIQRRLVKALEDVRIHYDGTVRNAQGQIIQFIYGDDGMDATKIEWENLETLKISNHEMEERFRWNLARADGFLDPKIIKRIKNNSHDQQNLTQEWQRLLKNRHRLQTEICTTGESGVCMPVHLHRLIWNAQNIYAIDLFKRSQLDPIEVITEIDKLCKELHIGGPGSDRKKATKLFRYLLRSTFASLRVAREFKLTQPSFVWILGEIRRKFASAIVPPGESVGTIAAQSIGEPTTQMTLNTFHLAGVDSALTAGVPRLKELINVAKNLKTPSCLIRLTPDLQFGDREPAMKLRNELEYLTLRKLTRTTEIWFDPSVEVRPERLLATVNEVSHPDLQITTDRYSSVVEEDMWQFNFTTRFPDDKLRSLLPLPSDPDDDALDLLHSDNVDGDWVQQWCFMTPPAKMKNCTLAFSTTNNLQLRIAFTLEQVTQTHIHYAGTRIQEDAEWLRHYMEYPDDVNNGSLSPWVLRIVLDPTVMSDKMTREGFDMAYIVKTIQASLVADNDEGSLSESSWIAHTDDNWTNESGPFYCIHIRIVENLDKDTAPVDDESLQQLEDYLLDSCVLLGHPRLNAIFLRPVDEHVVVAADGAMKKSDQKPWVLETEGVALQHILSTPNADPTLSSCNDINEILSVLGIEAARASIFIEIRSVMKFAGAYVNYRHLALLADVMTFRGTLSAITRFGINRSDNSALARCSFEETIDILWEAAQFAETDPLKAVSGNIMLGQLGHFGTGAFDLRIDEEMLKKAVEAPSVDWYYTSKYPESTPLTPFAGAATPYAGAVTPYNSMPSPGYTMYATNTPALFTPPPHVDYGVPFSPGYAAAPFSPAVGFLSPSSPSMVPIRGGISPSSPGYTSISPASPGYTNISPSSPSYSPGSGISPASPRYSPAGGLSPTSPMMSPSSPSMTRYTNQYSPSSPMTGAYSPASPSMSHGARYSPTSPTSPAMASPSSPSYLAYSPSSPLQSYSPSSPSQQPYSPSSPSQQPYSPTSPTQQPYSPSSPSQQPFSPSPYQSSYSPR